MYSYRRTYSSLDRGYTYRFHNSEVAIRATASKNGYSNIAGAKLYRSEKLTIGFTKAHLQSQYLT